MSVINVALDRADYVATRIGVRRPASFNHVMQRAKRLLYAGKLRRGLPQFREYYGITPFYPSSRNIPFDASGTLPLPACQIDRYQSEDVFEHIALERVPAIIADIHRVLKPGGLFRLSLPDYHFDVHIERTQKGPEGELLFDPFGGGRFQNGQVVDGGHVWFPTIEIVREIMEASPFAGHVRYLHYTNADGSFIMEPIDYSLGHIQRTPENDPRTGDRPRPISIVVDAIKA